jgi:uncharacterized membrane protein
MKDRKKLTLYTTQGALIAALYVVLTEIATLANLSSGGIQFRISEALCILPIFIPAAVPGLFVGCFISNLLVPQVVIWDIIFGSMATLIGAIGARMLRNLPEKLKWCATLPTVASNMIIVPLVLIFAYGETSSFLLLAIGVGIGEIVCAGIGGSGLYYILKKYEKQWLK